MKIPKVFSVREAAYVSVGSLLAALFITLFGGVVAGVLAAIAFVGGAYIGGLIWAPELFSEDKPAKPFGG